MPYVHGPAPLSGPEGIPSRIQRSQPASPAERASGQGPDRVEISDVAKWKARLAEVPAVRQDLVDAIRAQIEAGTYESADKIGAAAGKILDELKEEGAI